MTAVSFTWSTSPPDEYGRITVRERLEGTQHVNEYGPLPARVVDSFIRARRDVVSRFMSHHEAIRIFDPRPNLLEIARLQQKPRHED